jgi:hypothetical protein
MGCLPETTFICIWIISQLPSLAVYSVSKVHTLCNYIQCSCFPFLMVVIKEGGRERNKFALNALSLFFLFKLPKLLCNYSFVFKSFLISLLTSSTSFYSTHTLRSRVNLLPFAVKFTKQRSNTSQRAKLSENILSESTSLYIQTIRRQIKQLASLQFNNDNECRILRDLEGKKLFSLPYQSTIFLADLGNVIKSLCTPQGHTGEWIYNSSHS